MAIHTPAALMRTRRPSSACPASINTASSTCSARALVRGMLNTRSSISLHTLVGPRSSCSACDATYRKIRIRGLSVVRFPNPAPPNKYLLRTQRRGAGDDEGFLRRGVLFFSSPFGIAVLLVPFLELFCTWGSSCSFSPRWWGRVLIRPRFAVLECAWRARRV